MRTRIPKTVRRTIISIVVLLLVFILAGAAYVFIVGRSVSEQPPATVAPTTTAEPSALPKPVQPAANAKEGVAIEAVDSPVKAGENTSLTVLTNAGSVCTISVSYNSVKSNDSGLAPKPSNPYGVVNWTWTVERTAPVGSWPVKITCAYHHRTGVGMANIEVIK